MSPPGHFQRGLWETFSFQRDLRGSVIDGLRIGFRSDRDRLCVDHEIPAHSRSCENRVRRLQIHTYVGAVRTEPLACGLADRRNSPTNHPPISAGLPGELRLPANDQTEDRRSTVFDLASPRTTPAGRLSAKLPASEPDVASRNPA